MLPTTQIVEPSWLERPSPTVAPDLIGCTLVRQTPEGQCWRGQIVETEAYAPNDPACHAYRRRTARNFVMFGPAGTAYVYLIYGIYHCFNIVTDRDQVPSAVLIRALELSALPEWIDPSRRLKPERVAAGPGKLCQALKIDTGFTGKQLQPENLLWIEHRPVEFQQQLAQQQQTLIQTTRIGLTQGTDLPWRWYLKGCKAVSKP